MDVPDEVLLENMAFIVFNQRRPFSFRDFLNFDVGGVKYQLSHGTIRNRFMLLAKKGCIEFAYRTTQSYYTLPGQIFVRKVTASPHSGGPRHPRTEIHKLLEELPFDLLAIHDIRLIFSMNDAYVVLSNSNKYEILAGNRAIKFAAWYSRDSKIGVSVHVHRTDTVQVLLACSASPISCSAFDLMRLNTELVRVEERLGFAIDRERFPDVEIPEWTSWLCVQYHIGRDSIASYGGKRFEMTWKDLFGVLSRVYAKKILGKTLIRVEKIKNDRKTVFDLVNDLIDGSGRDFALPE